MGKDRTQRGKDKEPLVVGESIVTQTQTDKALRSPSSLSSNATSFGNPLHKRSPKISLFCAKLL